MVHVLGRKSVVIARLFVRLFFVLNRFGSAVNPVILLLTKISCVEVLLCLAMLCYLCFVHVTLFVLEFVVCVTRRLFVCFECVFIC